MDLYIDGNNRNLSWAILKILTRRIKCSTPIRSRAVSLFFCFWAGVSLTVEGRLWGVVI